MDVVSLSVTVTDGMNHYVTDLESGEFSVFEDGVKQDITFFNRRQQPIALSLLLDSSASMEQHLPMLQTAAGNFVKRLKPNDIAQVIDFDSRVEIRQAFTSNHAELEAAIQQTSAGGSTSLHNAIYIALRELRKVKAVTEEDVRRQALIVFSDGADRYSEATSGQVLARARRSQALVYPITMGKTRVPAAVELATLTGGRSFLLRDPKELERTLTTIARELRYQYLIGYVPSMALKPGMHEWRAIRVTLTTPAKGLRVRARDGYTAE